MLKKILFTLLTLLIIYSVSVTVYRIFEPKNATISPEDDHSISYDSLPEYLVSSGNGKTHYLFFYSSADNNSVYVRNTVLNQVESETRLSVSSFFEVVDITSLQENMTIRRLYDDWGIAGYPAFAAVSVKHGKPAVLNQLVWTDKKPVTAASVEEWMKENDLWTGNIQQ